MSHSSDGTHTASHAAESRASLLVRQPFRAPTPATGKVVKHLRPQFFGQLCFLYVHSFVCALVRGHVFVDGEQSFFLGAFHGRQQHALGLGRVERSSMENRNSPMVSVWPLNATLSLHVWLLLFISCISCPNPCNPGPRGWET